MKLNLIFFVSQLSKQETALEDHKDILDRLNAEYDIHYVNPEDLDKPLEEGATMVFIGSGGVEELVSAAIEKLPKYVLLIADGLKNSFAASLEILSWMRLNKRNGRVIHGDLNYMMRTISDYVLAYNALQRLQGQRVGVIGKPSSWLIASNIDYKFIEDKWNVKLVDLPLDDVISRYEKIEDVEVEKLADKFIDNSIKMIEPNRDDVLKAMRLYKAIKQIIEDNRLNAFTLNCFDLIPITKTTGCLALAILNEEGFPAGCEGDIQTILTMLVVKAVTNEPSFMANPSKIIDNDNHKMIFAHCTIAPCITEKYIIRSHYESLSGVAIEGIVSPQDVTILKYGGRNMERYFISDAKLLECTSNPNMCRTQMLLRLAEPLNYFLEQSIGNHHVIVKGSHKSEIEALLKILNR